MDIDTATIGRLVEDVGDEIVGWRRRLHQNPEPSFEEVETSKFVYETLESFGAGLELSRPTETSVLARLVGEKSGRTIAIRADMDALPVQEETGLPFASKNEGVSHACGHDGHTAILLGAARVFGELKEHVEGEVRFVFQHAEELPYGGAEELVEAGAVDGADAVIGLHLASSLETGKVGVSPGAVSAAPDRFEIVVEGAGGHAAWPHLMIDPMAVAAQVVTNLQHVVSRNTDAREAAVVSVTKIVGGTTFNVIPDKAEMEGTVRALDEEVRERLPELMERVAKGVAEAHGASCSFEYHRGPDPVVNDEEVARVSRGDGAGPVRGGGARGALPIHGRGGLLGLPAGRRNGLLPGGRAERREGHHPPEPPPALRHRRGRSADRREDVRPRGHEAVGCGISHPDRSQRGLNPRIVVTGPLAHDHRNCAAVVALVLSCL